MLHSLQKLVVLFTLLPLTIFGSEKSLVIKEFINSQTKIVEKLTSNLGLLKSSATLSSVFSNYKHYDQKYFRKKGFEKIVITNSEGYKTTINLKKSSNKAPLVFFIAGLGGTATSTSFVNYAIPLSEENDHHMVFVENATSPDWITTNENMFFSGFQSGWNLYLLIEQIIREKFRYNEIDKVSLVGLSLGGSDVFFASYFDSIFYTNYITGGVLAWSSPLDRYQSFSKMRDSTGTQKLLLRKLFEPIHNVLNLLPLSKNKFNLNDFAYKVPAEHILDQFFLPLMVKYFKNSKHWSLNDVIPCKGLDLRSTKCFTKISSAKYFMHNMTKPMIWIHAKNDPIVAFDGLERIIYKKKNPMIHSFVTEKGGHLGHPYTYGVLWIKQFIGNFINSWNT